MNDKNRPEVERFARAMEAKLRLNDHKGGWHNCDRGYLRRRMRTEMRELFAVLDTLTREERRSKVSARGEARHERACAKLLGECADIANFAMMLADTHYVLNGDRIEDLRKRSSR